MKKPHGQSRRRRAQGATSIVVLLMGVLGYSFFRVQVLGSTEYVLQAESNRLRALPIPAPRGTIFDRNGRVVADNVPGYAVTVIYEWRDSALVTLERLRPYLGLTDRDIVRLMREVDRYPGQPLQVDADADFHAISILEERRAEFPNVFIEMRPKRRYISGQALSHVVGYIGEITAAELDDPAFSEQGYRQRMYVGKFGIERQYEHMLQGQQGVRYVEVDARNRIVGEFAGRVQQGVPGGDIRLNLDLELQEYIHRIFPKSLTGAVVALDPADGGVLALYSWPTYDPNAFVGGIDAELWEQLNTDPLKPLYDRTVLGTFSPASAFKLVTAAIALERDVIEGNTRMPRACTGGITLNGVYQRCWRAGGHGSLDLPGAIMQSCNVYFYQLGNMIGLDRFLEGAAELGLGQSCGIDLPQENPGTFPESRDWWMRRFGYVGQAGEVTSLAIGQGPNVMTPLKLAQFYLALARDGSAPAPTIFKGRPDEPEGWELNLTQDDIDLLREGMRQVTDGGTANMSSLEHWDLIGKTGSGENPLSRMGQAETHAWFAGIAGPWGREPEIVVVALVEYGGGGSATAAPIAAKPADYHLRRKYGMPIDTVQTLREHLLAGRPAPWIARDRKALRAAGAEQPAEPTSQGGPDR
jgi:penicillin-binding protein 2